MAFLWIVWDDENDPLGNVQHIAEHGLTTDEVEAVLNEPDSADSSGSSGVPVCSVLRRPVSTSSSFSNRSMRTRYTR